MSAAYKFTVKQTALCADRFAALGDSTRLSLVTQLADGQSRSISTLTEGANLTRQGVTKHLRVLEEASIVKKAKVGRESLYEIDVEAFEDLNSYLNYLSSRWDQTLSRLKDFVEE